MARASKALGKNPWVLFLIILLGIVAGSLLGYFTRDIDFLKWLNKGMDFSIGDFTNSDMVTLDLVVLVIHFGLRIKITIGSIIGVIASVYIYKKIL